MQQEIKVTRIFSTRNPLIKTLELRTEGERSAISNPIAFFLQGAVNSSPEVRVAFVPVGTDFIDKYNISIGSDFAKSIGKPCKIVVREGFSPFRLRRDIHGKLVPQEPKKVPGISSNIYLCKDGQPIYRHTLLMLNPAEFEDVLIQHDPISDNDKDRMRNEKIIVRNQEDLNIYNPNIMTEPELD